MMRNTLGAAYGAKQDRFSALTKLYLSRAGYKNLRIKTDDAYGAANEAATSP